jgi:hypothetical protein
LERIRSKSLQQRYAQTHPRVADNDRLRGAPFLIRKFAQGNEIHFRREGCPVVERLADEANDAGDVGGCDRMTSCPKDIQRISITEEHSRLRLAHDHLRADPIITDTLLRETMDDLVLHFIRVFNDVKNSCHDISPLKVIAISL